MLRSEWLARLRVVSLHHIESAVSDDQLALAAGQRDAHAFGVLYVRYRRSVHRFVAKLVGAGPDCEDVIQDVFLQLYRALPCFRGESSLATFLRRITMNVACDHVRKRCRHQRITYDNDALDATADAGQDPEQHSSARQQLDSLLRHMDGIAPDQQRALMLVGVAGFSLNDAAPHLGVTATRVKQHVVRARRELTAMTARPRVLRRPRRRAAG
jgi:RNA polymerase sigma-70 factor, ECF subfamily